MLKVGVTGGIGSGKSVVCDIFKHLGIPVFNADIEAKKIMISNVKVIDEIKQNFGSDIYTEDSVLDKKKLAKIIFNNNQALNKINSIVHPAVKNEFDAWCIKHKNYSYVIEEAAILFESGAYKNMDKVINVTSPLELRLKRVVQRDKVKKEDVEARIAAQMNDDERNRRSDYIVYNDENQLLIPQILKIHALLLK